MRCMCSGACLREAGLHHHGPARTKTCRRKTESRSAPKT
jgi:hypothetical protein